MDGNKDEAERCIEIAEVSLKAGNYDKAEKFLLKAEKLYSTKKAKDILESLVKLKASSSSKNTDSTDNQARKRHKSNDRTQNEKPAAKEYTQEQLDEVRRINKCKNLYEALGVTKESTDSDIKKAYKKLALKLHPDKNKAPGANEAFKALGKAVTILTDAEKRKTYDMYGDSDERVNRMSSQSSGYSSHHHDFGFDSNVTPEDIFNMFFSGTHIPHQRRTFTRTYTNRPSEASGHHGHGQEPPSSILIQVFPLLILIAISMMSSLFISEPAYNLERTTKYPIPRHTNRLGVPYYVKENFHTEYQGTMRRLEESVEEDYVSNLRNMCYREKNKRDTLIWKARNFGDNDLYRQASEQKLPSCDSFRELSAKM